MSNPIKVNSTIVSSPVIRARVNSPSNTIVAKQVSAGGAINSVLLGTTTIENGKLLFSQNSTIEFTPIILNFTDNVTRIITLGNKTTESMVSILYEMSNTTDKVTGILNISQDGTDIFLDDERTIITEDISSINLTSNFAADSWKLNIVGDGVGENIEFKYFINNSIKL